MIHEVKDGDKYWKNKCDELNRKLGVKENALVVKKDIIRGSKAERKVLVAEKKNGAQKIRRRDNTLATVRALLEVEKRKARRFESQLSKLRSQKVGTAIKQSATEALKNKLQHCKDDNV